MMHLALALAASASLSADDARFTHAITDESLGAAVRLLPPNRSGWESDAHIRGLLEAQRVLAGRVRELGYTPAEFPVRWSRRRDAVKHDWANVVFEHPGAPGGPLAREVIIIGAHFDAVPATPGADDNATGVAALLEIARVMKDRPTQRTIRFVLFNLEEAGLVGAQQYARHVREEVKSGEIDVVLMLSLEMLGFYSDQPGSQKNPFKNIPGAPQATVGDFVALCGSSRDTAVIRALGEAMHRAEAEVKVLPIDLFPNEQMAIMPPDLLRSDHAPFLLLGMPAVMVTDTSEFRNPHYHKPTDTIDTLNMPMFTRTVRALAGAIDALAAAPGKPAPVLKRLEAAAPTREADAVAPSPPAAEPRTP